MPEDEVPAAPRADISARTQPAHTGSVRTTPSGGAAPATRWHGYYAAIAACLAVTALSVPLFAYFDPANIVMLFLLAIVLVAFRWGRGPAVLATVLSVASFDFFFVPPRFSMAISDVQYLVTFAVMLAVGMIVGHLTAGLRRQARVASQREARSLELYEFARDLSGALEVEQVARTAQDSISRSFGAAATVLVVDDDTPGGLRAPSPGAVPFDMAAARTALEPQASSGPQREDRVHYLPLSTSNRTRGVLALAGPLESLTADVDRRRALDTYGTLVATALERVHYVEVAQQATLRVESERLRNSLLSALSHDLRTPLTAMFGLADTLAIARPALPEGQREIVVSILDEARRMNALVNNLLDMARIESGPIRLDLQWQPVDEVIGSALHAVRLALSRHAIRVVVAPELPLVEFDAVLIERVLCNLLENASKYTPPGTTVTITAQRSGDELVVGVEDDGPGLPPGQEEAVFEKFTRGTRESATRGVGLGLAICRAIVGAHRGRIGARSRGGGGSGGGSGSGGAIFWFGLPLGNPPEMPVMHDESEPGSGDTP